MFLCCWLILGALIPMTLSTNPGVKVKLTAKGLEYGRQLGMASIQKRLKTIKVPDFSGTQKVSPIGKVQYSLSNMQIVDVGLPESAVDLVPGTGVRLSIGNAFMSLHGNWRVKYLRIIKDSGSFDLKVSALTVTTSIAIKSDETGRPAVSSVDCTANVGSASIKFHGGASWLYNLFKSFIDKALRNALQKQEQPTCDRSSVKYTGSSGPSSLTESQSLLVHTLGCQQQSTWQRQVNRRRPEKVKVKINYGSSSFCLLVYAMYTVGKREMGSFYIAGGCFSAIKSAKLKILSLIE